MVTLSGLARLAVLKKRRKKNLWCCLNGLVRVCHFVLHNFGKSAQKGPTIGNPHCVDAILPSLWPSEGYSVGFNSSRSLGSERKTRRKNRLEPAADTKKGGSDCYTNTQYVSHRCVNIFFVVVGQIRMQRVL